MTRNTVDKNITIKKYQEKWIQESHFKISSFIQKKLDELIKEREGELPE